MTTLINDTMDRPIQLKILLIDNGKKTRGPVVTNVVVSPPDKRSEPSAEGVHGFCMTDNMGELKSLLLGKFGYKWGRKDVLFFMQSGSTSKRQAIADVAETSPCSAFLDGFLVGLGTRLTLHADVVDSKTK